MLKILWLTIDRSNRVASHIFTGLQKAVKRQPNVHVDFIIRKIDLLAGEFCRATVMGGLKLSPVIDINKASEYDVIFTDAIFAYMSEKWDKINITKAVLIEDQHGPVVKKYVYDAFDKFGFNIFFVRYKNPTKRFHPYLYERKVFWLPHSIDTNFFKDYGLEKNIGVLNMGRMNSQVYPIRNKIHEELKSVSYYKRIQRPSEKINPSDYWPVGKDYARVLNRAKIVSSSTSVYNYPVLKFFEIPACRSVLMSNYIKELSELGFIPGSNFIKIKKNSNIKKVVHNYMKKYNSGLLQDIADKGYNLIHSKHTSEIRAREFIEYLKENI